MKAKERKVFDRIFLPPCPNCKTNKNVEDLGAGKVIICGFDFFKNIMEGKAPDSSQGHKYRCNKCRTLWDEDGGRISIT